MKTSDTPDAELDCEDCASSDSCDGVNCAPQETVDTPTHEDPDVHAQ